MIKKLLSFTLLFTAIIFSQSNVDLLSNLNQYPSQGYNDIWGYVDGSGIEYALLGCGNGTSIVRIDNPSQPQEVAFIPGPSSIWRDIKTHSTYAYIVTEGTGTGRGLQIVDLSQLPNTATLVNTIETWFTRAHNIFIDNGFAYVIGTNNGGGMHILDLTNPINPTRTNYYTASNYIHDVYVWNDTVVAAAEDSYDLINVSDKNNPQLISVSASLPGIYAHSGWMTEDKRYFFGTEEFNQIDITVWDLVDRTTWDLVVPTWQMQTNSTVHNLFIKDNYAHISYYSDGYVILDISDPMNPVLAGQYDTPDMWGCYPYLPSGITICSDIDNGLYVLQFNGSNIAPVISHTPVTEVLNSDPVSTSATIQDDGNITAANLRYRITLNGNTSSWNLVTDINGPSGNVYEFIIPGQSDDSFVEYYISAQDNDDNITTLPEGGSGINPPGSTPPATFFSYTITIPGIPIINSYTPTGDTTIAPNGTVGFVVNATDTSGFNLNYTWWKNSQQLANLGNNYLYVSNPNQNYPRVDTIDFRVTNGFNEVYLHWLITVTDPTNVRDQNQQLVYSLMQNYPNPFNPSTKINFSIPFSEFVNLSIYNSVGEKVGELVNEALSAGEYNINFEGADLPSGVYIAQISAGKYNQSIKMTLLK